MGANKQRIHSASLKIKLLIIEHSTAAVVSFPRKIERDLTCECTLCVVEMQQADEVNSSCVDDIFHFSFAFFFFA